LRPLVQPTGKAATHRLPRYLLALACSGLFLGAVAAGEEGKKAAPEKSTSEIDRLLRQLGSDEFGEREAASKTLEAIGEPARAALRKAASGNDAEVKRRAEKLIEKLDAKNYCELRCFTGHTSIV
jgi:hypothetical protein